MFLYLLNDNEGKAFMELAIQAMKVNGEEKDCEKAEYETYLTELNLTDYEQLEFHLMMLHQYLDTVLCLSKEV